MHSVIVNRFDRELNNIIPLQVKRNYLQVWTLIAMVAKAAIAKMFFIYWLQLRIPLIYQLRILSSDLGIAIGY
jgi:hypothetical protein